MATYLTQKLICERYGIASMTLLRWRNNSELAFPKPVAINGRLYWPVSEIEAFDARNIDTADGSSGRRPACNPLREPLGDA